MTRSGRRQVVLAGLVVLLALASVSLWLTESPGDLVATAHLTNTADRIVIRRPGRAPLELQRAEPALGAASPSDIAASDSPSTPTHADAGGWRIVAPHALPANARRLEPLFAVLQRDGAGYALEQIDLQAVGLETPAAIIEIGDRRFEIGGLDHTGRRRYLREGDHVRLIDDWLLSLVSGGLGAFAELSPFPSGIDALRLVGGPGAKTVTELAVDTWRSVTATQIVDWPRPPDEAAIVRQEHRLVAHSAAGTRHYRLAMTDRYAALVPDDARFAYVISPDDLPALPID